MRVLMVTGQLPGPGQLGSMGFTVEQIASLRALGITVEVVSVSGRRGIKYVEALPRVRRAAASVDLVHGHFGYSGWIARSQRRKPVVISFMGGDLLGEIGRNGTITTVSKFIVQVNRVVARTVDAVIVKSPEMARVVAPVPAHVIPNGVDVHTFAPLDRAEACARLGLDPAVRHVLFPSDPAVPVKNYALAQRVFQRVPSKLPFVVDFVTLGHVPHAQVPLYLNACDVALLTSHYEGSPNVVKEALACNLPVVAVPVGDVREQLTGIDPCAVCPHDPEALADGVAEVLKAGRRCNGRQLLHQRGLDLESVARRVLAVYEAVLTRRAAA